jgi:hypothetical protein
VYKVSINPIIQSKTPSTVTHTRDNMISLYNVLRGGNAVERFAGTIPLSRKTTIHTTITEFYSTGPMLDNKKSCKGHKLNEGKLYDVCARLEAGPKKQLHLFALQCGLAKCTGHISTKLLKLRPCRTMALLGLLP